MIRITDHKVSNVQYTELYCSTNVVLPEKRQGTTQFWNKTEASLKSNKKWFVATQGSSLQLGKKNPNIIY